MGATPGRHCRLKRAKSLTWDGLTWNNDIFASADTFRSDVDVAKYDDWEPQCRNNEVFDMKNLGLDHRVGQSLKENCLPGENTDEDQNRHPNIENTDPNIRTQFTLTRRATFCNFPKTLFGDHYDRGGHDHMQLRQESGCGIETSKVLQESKPKNNKLHRVDSSELVAKAFQPGILFGVQKRSPSPAKQASNKRGEVESQKGYPVYTNRNQCSGEYSSDEDDDDEVEVVHESELYTDEEITTPLPKPPPIATTVNQAQDNKLNYEGSNFSYNQGPPEVPPGMERLYQQSYPPMNSALPPPPNPNMPQHAYMQAMHSQLIYCMQLQQQMQQMMIQTQQRPPSYLPGSAMPYPQQFPNQNFGNLMYYDDGNFDGANNEGRMNKERVRSRIRKKKTEKFVQTGERRGSMTSWDSHSHTRQGPGWYQGMQQHPGMNNEIPDSRMGISPLLAEHKATGRRVSIEELKGHVLEFSKDSGGSRYVQHLMDISSANEKYDIIEEIMEHCVELMQDLFGNYVMQNFLDHASEEQKQRIIATMPGIVVSLSTQPHGCRVVQKAFDLAEPNLRNKLVSELVEPTSCLLHCARDQHATHVLQKSVQLLQRDLMPYMEEKPKRSDKHKSSYHKIQKNNIPKKQFKVDKARSEELLKKIEVAVSAEVMVLAINPNACRLVQRILADCDKSRSPQVAHMMDFIEKDYSELAIDQHGNFILQHILESGQQYQADSIQEYVSKRVIELSQHKFGSHLVEKALTTGSALQANKIILELLNAAETYCAPKQSSDERDGENQDEHSNMLLVMMKDPYANFVLQRALDVSKNNLRERLCGEITKRTNVISQFTYGRHILAHVAKLGQNEYH